MLFKLLLASITILLCFFIFFLTVFLKITVKIENARLKLTLTIPTSAPVRVANDAIEMNQLLQIKKLMFYQNSQKKQCMYEPCLSNSK